MIEVLNDIYTTNVNILDIISTGVNITKWKVIAITQQQVIVQTETKYGLIVKTINKEDVCISIQDAFEKAQNFLNKQIKNTETNESSNI
jgi:hypothetical protein